MASADTPPLQKRIHRHTRTRSAYDVSARLSAFAEDSPEDTEGSGEEVYLFVVAVDVAEMLKERNDSFNGFLRIFFALKFRCTYTHGHHFD